MAVEDAEALAVESLKPGLWVAAAGFRIVRSRWKDEPVWVCDSLRLNEVQSFPTCPKRTSEAAKLKADPGVSEAAKMRSPMEVRAA